MLTIVGISGCYGHDAAAAIVRDGVVVAALEEERVIRRKEAPGSSPVRALQACLDEVGLAPADIDLVAASWDPGLSDQQPQLARSLQAFSSEWASTTGQTPALTTTPHHLSHASASFLSSGFDEAAVIVTDGCGETASTSIYRWRASGPELVGTIPIWSSLGSLYSQTSAHVGFGLGAAGKTMGLAAFGRAVDAFPELELVPDGHRVRPSFALGFGRPHETPDWGAVLTRRFGPPAQQPPFSLRDIPQSHRDAAASVQATIERALRHLVDVGRRLTGLTQVVLSGGVALNCLANGRLRAELGPDDLFVLGASGDSGGSVGAALWHARCRDEPVERGRRTSLHLGSTCSTPAHLDAAFVDAGRSLGFRAERSAPEAVADRVAELVAGGRIGGWFRGRDELGPRALGGRSIIARADDAAVARRVNRIKGREPWRPLAPACTPRAAFAAGITSHSAERLDFMIEARWPCRAAGLEGVLHADGSTRPLVVHDADHPFADLLAALERHAGAGVLLNTSFNLAGEPIVHTPGDALTTFARSELDFLAVEGVLITRL